MTNSIPFFMFRMLVFPPMAGALTWFWLEIDFIRQLGAIDTIFFGGIFFSFAITMNTVNMRRFQAIDELAKIWSVALSFWNIGQLHLQKDKLGLFQQELQALFEKLRFFLHIDTVEEESKKRLADVDGFFGFLSKTIEEFRKDGLNSPELARLWGWHAEMYLAFEKLRAIKENRTPRALRVFIDWVLVDSAIRFFWELWDMDFDNNYDGSTSPYQSSEDAGAPFWQGHG